MRNNVLTTVGLMFIVAGAARCAVAAQADAGWIGRRVVPKNVTFTLVVNGEAVVPSTARIDVYRVEQVDGPSLMLKAETRGTTGWAPADHVVPVDQAVPFYTEQIRTHPADAFFRAARALIWSDKKAFDNALHDLDEAIRLEPNNASHHCRRGQVRYCKQEYDRSIADFDAAIRLDPKSAVAFEGRGASRSARKEYSKAIADDSEAIWLDPLAIAAYDNRGLAWYATREFAKAIVDYNTAIRLDSQRPMAYCNRGSPWAGLGRFDRAIADYNQAIDIDQRCACAYGRRAWIWAACPDARYRDGKKAVESATRACELSGGEDAGLLNVLAAAYAEADDFQAAVTWQIKANALQQPAEEKTRGQARLKLYQGRKAVRDPNV